MGYSSDKMANNTSPQETLVKELGLPYSSNFKSIRGTRNIRLLIPINNAFGKLSQQNKTAGEHWSLLKCDIQASNKGVKVQFGHFDSIENSSNGEVSDVVACKIYEVSFFCLFFIWYVLIISLT